MVKVKVLSSHDLVFRCMYCGVGDPFCVFIFVRESVIIIGYK